MKKILIFESCPGSPHTETSLELALREKQNGNQVFFAPLFAQNSEWEYAQQYAPSSRKALSGFILENIIEVCKKFDIRVLKAEKSNKAIDRSTINNLLSGSKFEGQHDFRSLILSTVSGLTNTADPDLLSNDYNHLAIKFSEIAIDTYFNACDLINQIKPDLIYYYNGRWASCAPIRWAAEERNIKILLHERGANINKFCLYEEVYYKYSYTRNKIKKLASITDPDIVKSIGSSFYIKKRNRMDTTWPSFATQQTELNIPDALKNKPYICYFSSSEDEFTSIPGNRVETHFGRQFDAFLLLKNVAKKIGKRLVVRVHPNVINKHKSEAEFWLSQGDPNTIIFGPEDKIDTYTLIDNAESVVTYATTVGIEAAYAQKPSILLGYSLWYDEPGFHTPRSESELMQFLNKPVASYSEFTYQFGYYMDKFGEEFKFFTPSNFWSGKFMGHKIQPSTAGMQE
jgi:hypothetical protein